MTTPNAAALVRVYRLHRFGATYEYGLRVNASTVNIAARLHGVSVSLWRKWETGERTPTRRHFTRMRSWLMRYGPADDDVVRAVLHQRPATPRAEP